MTISSLPDARELLAVITGSSPEWKPWVALLELTLEEVSSGQWDSVVLVPGTPTSGDAPLLDGASLHVPVRLARSWVQRLLKAAGDSGGPDAIALRAAAQSATFDSLAFLQAAVRQESETNADIAEALSIEPASLAALAQLAVTPMLQAMSVRLSSIKPSPWPHNYCPICGTLTALAELRGLERTRWLRCGRCGSDWEIDRLRCAYCRTTDQRRLGSLVPEEEGELRKVDTCRECGGYIKIITTLRAWPSYRVALEDLASVDLDLVALEHGFARPDSGEYRPQLEITGAMEKRRFLGLGR